jgi:hypothetical protein
MKDPEGHTEKKLCTHTQTHTKILLDKETGTW